MIDMQNLAPIVLFVYKRPWHTRQTVEALQKNILAEKSILFIFSDDPKSERDEPKVNEVRKYIKEINGFKAVEIIEREKNYGLANNIIDGVTRIVKVILNKDPSYPKISIVTPYYNQAEFLERTILSVLNQNYPNLEYIIIDDGSTDGNVDIIKKYEKYLAYWVSEKDNGQAHALNKGFKIATGEILGWLNSDDLYLPNCLFRVAEQFSSNNDVDCIYGNTYIIDSNDFIVYEHILYLL